MRFSKIIGMIALTFSLYIGLGSEEIHIPFQLKRNVVIIPVRINNSSPFHLILDTGMTFDGVYLFNDRISKEIDKSKMIQVKVPGAGSGEPSTALMIEDGILSFGDVSIDSQRVIISTSQYTRNFPSDGVIGWNLFGHYIVGIDYDTEIITLHSKDFIAQDSGWQVMPITLKKNTPFLNAKVEVIEGETTDVNVYIDLGSGKALELLTSPAQKYRLPDSLKSSYLGTGLSGDIEGYYGMSRRLWLGNYMLSHIPTAFAPAEIRSKQEGAEGILGDDCIRRFNVIFDYPHNLLYLRANKYFSTPFD